MFEQIKAVLFDLDGTIYYGSKLIDGADQVVDAFRRQGKEIFFLTNNSTKTRSQIHDKLLKMGLSCNEDEVYTSGYATGLYIKKQEYKDVYVFGTQALKSEFEKMGIRVTNQG